MHHKPIHLTPDLDLVTEWLNFGLRYIMYFWKLIQSLSFVGKSEQNAHVSRDSHCRLLSDRKLHDVCCQSSQCAAVCVGGEEE